MKTAEEVVQEIKEEAESKTCKHGALLTDACGLCERTGVKIVDITPDDAVAAGRVTLGLERVFHIEVESFVEAARWQGSTRQNGTFTVRRLDIGAKGRMGVTLARLNGGVPTEAVDPGTFHLHSVLAYLKEAVVQAPSWWTPDQFLDGSILYRVYSEVDRWEGSFRKGVRG